MDQLWTHLSDKGLHIDVSNVHRSCLCMLCNSIMRHPVFAKCGCVFCEHCIREYLLEDRKPCPGCLKENEMTEIEYDNDVTECKKSSREISRLVVACPLDGCEESFELRALLEHILSCSMTKSGCLPKPIECSTSNMSSAQLEVYLSEESMKHHKLIVDALCKMKNGFEVMQADWEDGSAMRNEMAQMKEDFTVLRAETEIRNNEMTTANKNMAGELNTEELRGAVEQSKNTIETMRRDIIELKVVNDVKGKDLQSVDEKYKLEITNFTSEVNNRKKDNSDLRQLINNNKDEIENERKENVKLRNILDNNSGSTNKFQKEDDEVADKGEKMKSACESWRKENAELSKIIAKKTDMKTSEESSIEINNLEKQIEELKKDLNNTKEALNQQKEEKIKVPKSTETMAGVVSRVETVEKTLESLNCASFVWRVEDLPGKRAAAKQGGAEMILSPPFFSQPQGYRFCIKICPDGGSGGAGTHLSVYFVLMKGDNDDILRWPCRRIIQLSIISQDDGTEVAARARNCDTTREYNQHAFDRPTEEMNGALGYPTFISWDTLISDNSVMKEGIVYINCSISPS